MSDPPPDDDLAEDIGSSIWKLLNLPHPRTSDPRDAPEVDREILRKLVRKELPKDSVGAAYMLIHAFDSWKEAFAQIVIEEFRRGADKDPQLPTR